MKPPDAKSVEWELLPPEEKQRRAALEPLFKWLAVVMDDLLRIPGTNFRFGLDPIIGLIPGIGDTSSAVASGIALISAVRHGIPKIIIARMALNVLVNEAIGVVPIAGDAFSFWFKSNKRNYDLLKKHVGTSRRAGRSDWVFVFGILGTLVLIVCVGVAVSVWALSQAGSFFIRR